MLSIIMYLLQVTWLHTLIIQNYKKKKLQSHTTCLDRQPVTSFNHLFVSRLSQKVDTYKKDIVRRPYKLQLCHYCGRQCCCIDCRRIRDTLLYDTTQCSHIGLLAHTQTDTCCNSQEWLLHKRIHPVFKAN